MLVSHRMIENNEKNPMKKNYQIIVKPGFSVSKKSYHKIETKNDISINIFGYENRRGYSIYLSNKNI